MRIVSYEHPIKENESCGVTKNVGTFYTEWRCLVCEKWQIQEHQEKEKKLNFVRGKNGIVFTHSGRCKCV